MKYQVGAQWFADYRDACWYAVELSQATAERVTIWCCSPSGDIPITVDARSPE